VPFCFFIDFDMEALKDIPTSLPAAVAPTYKVLLPHLIANKDVFAKQYDRRETYSYGSDPRQELDVYYPHSVNDSTPVLLFLYGGGFFMGDKRSKQHPELMYANLGAFFCDKGFITVIADYRLSKGPGGLGGNAKYPSGAEDIVGALKGIAVNLGKTREVFLMGNSAGAVHVMTFLLEPSFLRSIDANIAGAVLVSPPAHQRSADSNRAEVNAAYYGSLEATDTNSPYGLLLRNGPVSVPMLSMVATLDEAGIIKSWADFSQEYAKQGGKCDEIPLEGHNHMSPILALNSTETEGTKWGSDAAQWMLKQMKNI
jgi:acetyl esterase/lipase